MKITYVLPVYNAQNTLTLTIKSLLEQTLPGEIIVIDDASTDYTKRTLNFFKKKVKVIQNEKRMGAAYCRNIGNKEAKGDIIAVCDSDFYYKRRGEAIQAFFKEHKEMAVFYSALELRPSKTIEAKYLQNAFEWDFKSKCPISHPTVAYKREWAFRCPYHEKTLASDLYEFCLLDMHKKGAKFGWAQEPLMLKVEGNTQRNKEEAKKIKVDMYKEHGIEVREDDFG